MRNVAIIFLVLIFTTLNFFYGVKKTEAVQKKTTVKPQVTAKKSQSEPQFSRVGERITYIVKLGKVSLGRAVFYHVERSEFKGYPADTITFTTKLTHFQDVEKIYSDAKTFLPLKVEREIYNWPLREQITEEYDQKKCTLTIHKVSGKKKEEMFIRKNSVIHNAILLPYYVRRMPKLNVGWILPVELPTQSFQIKLVSLEEIKVPAGKFKTYHFESLPKKIEIWVTADEYRIPVKIKGTSGIGYSMLMIDYTSK